MRIRTVRYLRLALFARERERIIKRAPLSLSLKRRLRTDGKERPHGQQKVYWDGCPSSNHLGGGQRRSGEGGDGVDRRNESSHYPGIHRRNTRQLMGNF